MLNNGAPKGMFFCTPEQEWNAFERLPKSVRDALNDADIKLSAAALAKKKWPTAKMLSAIKAKSQGDDAWNKWKRDIA